MSSLRNRRIGLGVAVAVVVIAIGGVLDERTYEQHDLTDRAEALTGGSVTRGRVLFAAYGCGGCHTVDGVPQAQGLVGPPLDTIAVRAMIGGRLSNTPAHLEQWIQDPQAVSPGTAMPALGVTPAQSRDLAAFLYTQS
jgi:cytochrome c1